MKRLSVLSKLVMLTVLATACSSYNTTYKVVSLSKNTENIDVRNGVVYTLPKTTLNFEVFVKKQEIEKGIYADYAEKLLGVKAFSNERQTTYAIVDVKFSTGAEPDIDQYYFVSAEKANSNMSLLLSPEGFLQSVNYKNATNSDFDKKGQNKSKESLTSFEKYILANNNLLLPPPQNEEEFIVKKRYEEDSLIEEVVPVKPVAFSDKALDIQAKEAAKFIKSIQEKKIQLISGEYEDQYSPNAVEFLYKKLDNMEKQYMELFTGTFRVSTSAYNFSVVPQKNQLANNEMIIPVFSFSEKEGILPLDSPSKKTAYTVRLRCENILHVLNNSLANSSKDKEEKTSYGFYYRIPETVTITYSVGSEEKTEKTRINQLGTVMNLPHYNFRALFDAETGNVLEYRSLKKN